MAEQQPPPPPPPQQPPAQLQLANGISIKRFDQLELLILQNNPKDVVLFGEGNFTFSIALASLRRNGSHGITATRYGVGALPQFDDVKKKAVTYCIHNGEKLGLSAERKLRNILAVVAVPNFSDTWRAGIDATKIPADLVVAGKVVWFQCPWSLDPATLIQGFMEEMARKQRGGDYLIIGIANHADYFGKYKLKNILGDGQEGVVFNRYGFIGGDKELIKKILEHGYKHEGYFDIHDFIFHDHVTLVFKRENQAQAQDQDQDLPQIAKLKLNEEGGGEGEGGSDDLDPTPVAELKTGNSLLIEEKKEVVIFKEDDPSLSMALASLRGNSWDGIKFQPYIYPPNISKGSLFSMMEQCMKNGKELRLKSDEIFENIKAIQECPLHDTCNHTEVNYAGKVILYQLPPSTIITMEDIKKEIKETQSVGDYLLIGITTSTQYKNLSIDPIGEYELIGKDTELINKITARGYKHGSSEAMILIYKKDIPILQRLLNVSDDDNSDNSAK